VRQGREPLWEKPEKRERNSRVCLDNRAAPNVRPATKKKATSWGEKGGNQQARVRMIKKKAQRRERHKKKEANSKIS